jgi:hypothetical protein
LEEVPLKALASPILPLLLLLLLPPAMMYLLCPKASLRVWGPFFVPREAVERREGESALQHTEAFTRDKTKEPEEVAGGPQDAHRDARAQDVRISPEMSKGGMT